MSNVYELFPAFSYKYKFLFIFRRGISLFFTYLYLHILLLPFCYERTLIWKLKPIFAPALECGSMLIGSTFVWLCTLIKNSEFWVTDRPNHTIMDYCLRYKNNMMLHKLQFSSEIQKRKIEEKIHLHKQYFSYWNFRTFVH